jgi:hypothetical protein
MKGSHSRRRFFAGPFSENHYLCSDANTLFILGALAGSALRTRRRDLFPSALVAAKPARG